MEPRLVHARKAKIMLASSKKTDKLRNLIGVPTCAFD